jgi:hypothetical protein
MGFFDCFDLEKPCDACGAVDAGLKWCPKCKISFCSKCYMELYFDQIKRYPKSVWLVCPLCHGLFEAPE